MNTFLTKLAAAAAALTAHAAPSMPATPVPVHVQATLPSPECKLTVTATVAGRPVTLTLDTTSGPAGLQITPGDALGLTLTCPGVTASKTLNVTGPMDISFDDELPDPSSWDTYVGHVPGIVLAVPDPTPQK